MHEGESDYGANLRGSRPLTSILTDNRTKTSRRAGRAIAVALLLCAGADAPNAKTPGEEAQGRLSWAPLENVFQASAGLYSGGEPRGDEAFSLLAERGVRTIVSVDGAKPDVEAARRKGIRYVHIPFGYDGVDQASQAALTRVMREATGPIYVHCHHGKHRGPAAAAIACLAAGRMTTDEAITFMRRAGTGAEYRGLWRDVEKFQPLPADAQLPSLVETAKVDSLAEAMASLGRSWDQLKLCQDSGWKVPPGHPDVSPEHEALLVWEGLRECGRNLSREDAQLEEGFSAATREAAAVRAALKEGRRDAASAALKRLDAACQACHVEHRN
jgi:protein tyrosine phosphatase (PTP) superfamily phosphohydrolase (DUF442 family)